MEQDDWYLYTNNNNDNNNENKECINIQLDIEKENLQKLYTYSINNINRNDPFIATLTCQSRKQIQVTSRISYYIEAIMSAIDSNSLISIVYQLNREGANIFTSFESNPDLQKPGVELLYMYSNSQSYNNNHNLVPINVNHIKQTFQLFNYKLKDEEYEAIMNISETIQLKSSSPSYLSNVTKSFNRFHVEDLSNEYEWLRVYLTFLKTKEIKYINMDCPSYFKYINELLYDSVVLLHDIKLYILCKLFLYERFLIEFTAKSVINKTRVASLAWLPWSNIMFEKMLLSNRKNKKKEDRNKEVINITMNNIINIIKDHSINFWTRHAQSGNLEKKTINKIFKKIKDVNVLYHDTFFQEEYIYTDKIKLPNRKNKKNNIFFDDLVRMGHSFLFDRHVQRQGELTDINIWRGPPQWSVNSVYQQETNTIFLCLGISITPFLQRPYLRHLPENFAGIFRIVAHEFAHIFDPEGCKVTKNGLLKRNWDHEDIKKFDQWMSQFSNSIHEVILRWNPSQTSKQTKEQLNELFADWCAIHITWEAFLTEHEKYFDKYPSKKEKKLFFIHFSKLWNNCKSDKILNNSVHSSSNIRVNAILSLFQPFQKLMNLSEKDKLFYNVKEIPKFLSSFDKNKKYTQ